MMSPDNGLAGRCALTFTMSLCTSARAASTVTVCAAGVYIHVSVHVYMCNVMCTCANNICIRTECTSAGHVLVTKFTRLQNGCWYLDGCVGNRLGGPSYHAGHVIKGKGFEEDTLV